MPFPTSLRHEPHDETGITIEYECPVRRAMAIRDCRYRGLLGAGGIARRHREGDVGWRLLDRLVVQRGGDGAVQGERLQRGVEAVLQARA